VTGRLSIRFGAALLLAALLAFGLRDVIERSVILPLAYLWWFAGLLFHSVPQWLVWIALCTLALFTVLGGILPTGQFHSRKPPTAKPARGQIESLADWIGRAPGGIYYKWLVANRLGKLARELLAQREGHGSTHRFGRLVGSDWQPPAAIDAYLESGLNGSFAEYPRSRWPWSAPVKTPLDMNPEQVIEYLEVQAGEHQ